MLVNVGCRFGDGPARSASFSPQPLAATARVSNEPKPQARKRGSKRIDVLRGSASAAARPVPRASRSGFRNCSQIAHAIRHAFTSPVIAHRCRKLARSVDAEFDEVVTERALADP